MKEKRIHRVFEQAQDTGALEGPRFRYVLPGAEGWRATDTWQVPGVVHRSPALRADRALGDDEGKSGSRTLMALGAGLNRVQTSETDPSSSLAWLNGHRAHFVIALSLGAYEHAI